MGNQPAATMSVSLPKELKEHIKRRVKQEHFGTPSDYIRSLVRQDLKRDERERLESLLLEGLASGPSTAMTAGEWKKLQAEVHAKAKERA